MSVDLNKNRSELLNAFQEVTSTKNKTDWVLYGYDGQTNVLKLVSKGDDGIEGLVDELNSGKIMYAYCQVKDPNTDLPKLVCINWQGEGVPEQKKGKCANHISDVSRLFRGAHVTINARSDDDVDEEDIIKKVAKSSGANYSVHKEKPQPNANKPSGPIGSVYVKTRPHQEIKTNVREKFWQQQQAEEKNRQEFLRQKSVDEKQKLDKEVKERELKEMQMREQREKERLQKIVEIRQAEKRANAKDTEAEKKQWEKTQIESRQDEEERAKRGEQLRKERASEAKSLLSQRGQDPRTMFEQKPVSQFDDPARGPPPQRKLKHDFLEEKQAEDSGRKQQIQLPKADPSPAPKSPPVVPPARVAAPPPEPPSPSGQPHTRNLLAEGLPPRQDSDEEAEEQDWDGGIQKSPEPTTEDFQMPKQSMEPEPEPQDDYDDVQHAIQSKDLDPEDTYDDVQHVSQAQHVPEDTYAEVGGQDDTYADVGPAAGGPPEELYDDVTAGGDYPPSMGLVARALYDYQALEENEVTFDPGDLITNIDQVDPGWWVGVAPDGTQGMFPSNYVELLNA